MGEQKWSSEFSDESMEVPEMLGTRRGRKNLHRVASRNSSTGMVTWESIAASLIPYPHLYILHFLHVILLLQTVKVATAAALVTQPYKCISVSGGKERARNSKGEGPLGNHLDTGEL